MNDNLEKRVKKILSMRRKLEAQLLFYQIDADYKQKDYMQNQEVAKLKCQQTALKKISSYITQYAKKIDFSWMDDLFFQ